MLDSLKKFSLNDLELQMRSDSQYTSISDLLNWKNRPDIYLVLIIMNALVCYQLSWTWEKYWDEFSNFFWKTNYTDYKDITTDFLAFLQATKYNKRLSEIKNKRVSKIDITKLSSRVIYIYSNINTDIISTLDILSLLEDISVIMNQKITDKTIIFSLKMFYYWLDSIFIHKSGKIPELPKLPLPIDSRIQNLFEKEYWISSNSAISKKMIELQKQLPYSLLYYDAVLWPK